MSSSVTLHAAPESAVLDVPFSIRVTGLVPSKPVKLRASHIDHAGVEWAAEALYKADATGIVDLNEQTPESAAYSDADPMGLIWSMTPVEEDKRYEMLTRSPDLSPFVITFSVIVDGQTVATKEVERLYMAPGVQRIEVRKDGLFGTLFIPAGDGPHPAITLVSGSGGGIFEYRAALYAAHGVAAFALAYFNYETLPKILVDIPLEYFEKSIQYLQHRDDIDGDRLAITGGSRGGELSLVLGSVFPAYKVVIADVPSGIVWGGFGHDPVEGNKAAWIHNGEPLPYMDAEFDPDIYSYYGDYTERGEAIPGTPGFLETMKRNEAVVKKAGIPVENIRGAVLLISGEDDQMWPSTDLADIALRRLEANNFPYPYEHVSYPNVGHLIMPPYGPTTIVSIKHPVDGGYYAFGGKPEANYRAGIDSWHKTLGFLKTHL